MTAVEDVYYAGQLINGEESELRVVVKNIGAKDIYSLKISIFFWGGATKQIDLVDSSLVGESRLFILPVDVRINGTEEKVVVQVIEKKEIAATADFMLNLKLMDISIATDI